MAGSMASSWLQSGVQGSLQLGLLPCSIEDAMHPGETRELFTFEDRFTALFKDAIAMHGCIGALLFTEEGEAVDLCTLLEVEDFKSDSYGSWARLKCVGRCMLSEMRTSANGYQVSNHVSVYMDEDEGGAAPALSQRARRVHASAAKQRRELYQLLAVDLDDFGRSSRTASPYVCVGPHKRDTPFGAFQGGVLDDDYDLFDLDEEAAAEAEAVEYVFVGLEHERPRAFGTTFFHCRDHGELDDEENGKSLDEMIATRYAVLTSSGAISSERGSSAGSGGSSSGGRGGGSSHRLPAASVQLQRGSGLKALLGDVWQVHSEAEAERQLFSFALAATLDPAQRFESLLMTDTTERIEFALDALTEQHYRLDQLLTRVGDRYTD